MSGTEINETVYAPYDAERKKKMEAIIFCGLQASGKSTFYKENFYNTHLRINLDMLRTRRREMLILEACLKGRQRFVIDNTNPTIEDRARYLELAEEHNFSPVGYYFDENLADCLSRNSSREGKACIPEKGLRATDRKLQIPELSEGFRELYQVRIKENGFEVEKQS